MTKDNLQYLHEEKNISIICIPYYYAFLSSSNLIDVSIWNQICTLYEAILVIFLYAAQTGDVLYITRI